MRTCAEFFAGIGLMRMGLEREGWEVVFANDIDTAKREMYAAQFPDASHHFVCADVHTLDPRTIPSVELATASFPCTDLSLAGARKGLAGEQSSALWGFLQAIRGMGGRKPSLILLENVPGFLTSHGGEDFKAAMVALNELGYSVDPFILDAACFVPQSRQRLFVVATRIPLGSSFELKASLTENSLRPRKLVQFVIDHPEIEWKLRDLPQPPLSARRLPDILEVLPESNPAWWPDDRAEYLLSQMSPKHRAEADALISADRVSYGTVFRRIRNGRSMAELRTDGIAGCLRTPKGGSGRQILARMGQGSFRARLLTPRECARLMSADGYVLNVSLNQALFGFGDAVCVDAVAWIARHYLSPALEAITRPQEAQLCLA